MNWIFWALLSAFFAAATALLAEVRVTGIDSNLATAIRTTVIVIFTWAIALQYGDAPRNHTDLTTKLALPGALRNRNRTLLALLFSRASTRTRLKRRSRRQAQRSPRHPGSLGFSRRAYDASQDPEGPPSSPSVPCSSLSPEYAKTRQMLVRSHPVNKRYNRDSSLKAQCKVGASSRWGRHGFDGIACGREACRGVDTRNRSQNYKCRTSIRACCLIN